VSANPPIEPRKAPPKVAVLAADRLVRAALERILVDHGIPSTELAQADLAILDLGASTRTPEISVPWIALVDEGARPADLLARGASAVLRRDPELEERLSIALMAVHLGLVVVDAPLARDALPEPWIDLDEGEDLTLRERKVLTLIASGLSNKKIAQRLGISEHTAKFHVNSILAKLGASTRTEAVVIAAQRGLLWL
jgi:two-component system, NarL family, nitrate/nitrite response regulator NarL